MKLTTWCAALIEDVVPIEANMSRKKRRRKGVKTLADSEASIQLDERFSRVPCFTGLKCFRHFSKIKQWSGNKQKAMVRQLIPVLVPLLAGKADAAIYCG